MMIYLSQHFTVEGDLYLFLALSMAFWLGCTSALRWLHRSGRIKGDYHNDLAILGLLGLAVVGFFWRLLFTPAWMPADGGDLLSFHYASYRFAAESLREGHLPLWNPCLYGGTPFAADIQQGLFYPVNLLFFLLSPQVTFRTLELLSVLHFYLAGAFMYLCLRFLGARLNRLSCLAGAVAFMFSDIMIIHFGNLSHIATISWTPLVFLFHHRSLKEKNPSRSALAGIFLGVAFLGGHVQYALIIAFLMGLYLLYRSYLARREGWRSVGLLFGLAALTILVALTSTALATLPAIQLATLSSRSHFTYEEAAQFSLNPAQLIGLLNPAFFGRGPAQHWGLSSWERTEVGYIGLFPLLLAALALGLRRERLTRFLLAAAILGLLLSLGENAILHGWLFQFLPGFDKMRAPARFMLLFDFAVAALAAYGLDGLSRPLDWRAHGFFKASLGFLLLLLLATTVFALPLAYAVLIMSQDKDPVILERVGRAVGGLVLFLLFLAGGVTLLQARARRWLRPRLVLILAVALIYLDLSATGAYIDLGNQDPTGGFNHPQAVAFLRADPSWYRIDSVTGAWKVWQPNLALAERLFDVGGIYNPLVPDNFGRYWDGMGGRSSPLYDLLNVKYIVVEKGSPLKGKKYALAFQGDPEVDIYLNEEAYPRAFIVHTALVAPHQEAAWEAIHAPGFDPATTVVVEGGKGIQGPPQEGESAEIVDYSPNRVVVQAGAVSEGYLFLSEVYYPGWRAYLDGIEEPVLRANYAFRAVHLPPGAHQVELIFRPPWWARGLILSAVTWLGLALGGGWHLLGRARSKALPKATR